MFAAGCPTFRKTPDPNRLHADDAVLMIPTAGDDGAARRFISRFGGNRPTGVGETDGVAV